MRKYLQIFKISWANSLIYRLNFLMWRFRSVIMLLTLYYLWFAVYNYRPQIGNYTRELMLTYILGTSLLRIFVGGSRNVDVSAEISLGDLSNYLIKPLNYFYYWLTRDFADKALNLVLLVFELTLIFLLIKPPFFLQTNMIYLSGFILTSILGMLLFFYLSMIISLTAFWFPEMEGWPQRFLFAVIIEFLCGLFLPLDIFPPLVFQFFSLLPSTYMIFFPLKFYLGNENSLFYLKGLVLMLIWLYILKKITYQIWCKGLRRYGAEGK